MAGCDCDCEGCDCEEIQEAVNNGYLAEICDYEGIGADLPRGILNAPPGVGIIAGPGVDFPLTSKDESGWVIVDEALVKKVEKQWGDLKFSDANGTAIYTRKDFRKKYGKDPIWQLGWMRAHQGVSVGGVTVGSEKFKPKF